MLLPAVTMIVKAYLSVDYGIECKGKTIGGTAEALAWIMFFLVPIGLPRGGGRRE